MGQEEDRSDDIICRLPSDWQKFFKYLAIDEVKAEIVYNDMMYSQYGTRPEWATLLKALQAEDPYIEDNRLIFKPRLLLLPEEIQEQFFRFLLSHCCRIPDWNLRPFIGAFAKHYNPESKHCESFLRLAKTFQISLKTPENQPQFDRDKDFSRDKDINEFSDSLKTTYPAETEELVDDDVIIIDEEECEQPVKRPRLDLEPTEPGITNNENDENISVGHSKVETVENVIDDKINYKTIEGKEADVGVSEEILDIARRLREIWNNGDDEPPREGLTELSTLTVAGIQCVCQSVEFPSMGDDVILTVSGHVTEMWECFSYTAVVCVLNYLLFNRIERLTQNASRQLTNAITLTAGKFPKQFIDAVMIPGFVDKSELSSFMCDVYVTVTKESLSSGTRLYFLQQLVTVSNELTENCFGVLQCVLDSGCDFNENVFHKVLEMIQELGLKFAKDLKLGKLLLSFTNKHSKDMKNRDLLEKVVNSHNTFLKKTIIASLKRIKS